MAVPGGPGYDRMSREELIRELHNKQAVINHLNSEPIKMMLFCPRCRTQHIDMLDGKGWDNPPHATHTCCNCGLLWRPANENTTGVSMIHVEEQHHKTRIFACIPPVMLAQVRVEFRPLLTQGMLATDYRGVKILIDEEQPVDQQITTLWHETLHLLGLTNEEHVEGLAVRLATASPEIIAVIKEIAACSPKSN